MVRINIDDVLKNMAQPRPVFHSEADFQHALAWTIREKCGESQVRLEYPIRLLSSRKGAKGAVDIWIGDSRLAIELKYKTSALSCDVNGESYDLKLAKTHRTRYDFVEDVAKLESIVDGHRVRAGYAILLTNDMRAWSKSRKPSSVSSQFNLVGTLGGKMDWLSGERKSIVLKKHYSLTWNGSSTCGNSLFRFLSVCIG